MRVCVEKAEKGMECYLSLAAVYGVCQELWLQRLHCRAFLLERLPVTELAWLATRHPQLSGSIIV